jgi:2-polyprenyl-3-methyl-5-hydroxy-6-metoxy-1,4-benzoquinol methylase
MTNSQEIAYPAGFDYEVGSPHLKHVMLRSRINESLLQEVARLKASTGGCRVLEIGAGHGSFSAVLIGAGAELTITEMSRPSADHLARIFADQPNSTVVHDGDGRWAFETDQRFDLVVAISVLHHIPDYLRAVGRYVEITNEGGSFLSWQDPAWYSRQSHARLIAARAAYYAWRLGQGSISRGLATRMRRLRGILDESNVSDMSEYHVVRNGVDELALLSLLRTRFEDAALSRYWSTQAGPLQRLGEHLGLEGTFGLCARGRRPRPGPGI